MIFSRRAPWSAPTNALTQARHKWGGEILDLTESNPTRAGIPYPLDELAEIMARAARASYDPSPLGLKTAREAIAEAVGANAEDIVVTASTSEAYGFLFKLLADPGGEVLTATPSYPLLEHLASLELVVLRHFALQFQGRWEIDPAALNDAVTARSVAIVAVNPNNPTGSYVTRPEQDAIARHGIPIISDEVFYDYSLGQQRSAKGPSFVRDDVLTFTLGGLSKGSGLPHYKLGWIRLSGPLAVRRQALAGLELIADSFLSVSTSVQTALPELLRLGPSIQKAISLRVEENLTLILRALAPVPSIQLLPLEGGWSAVLRLPRVRSDEEMALKLVQEHGVVVYPGYFFDFPSDGYLVISLLTPTAVLEAGMQRIASVLA